MQIHWLLTADIIKIKIRSDITVARSLKLTPNMSPGVIRCSDVLDSNSILSVDKHSRIQALFADICCFLNLEQQPEIP